jgi:hypothetical protein
MDRVDNHILLAIFVVLDRASLDTASKICRRWRLSALCDALWIERIGLDCYRSQDDLMQRLHIERKLFLGATRMQCSHISLSSPARGAEHKGDRMRMDVSYEVRGRWKVSMDAKSRSVGSIDMERLIFQVCDLHPSIVVEAEESRGGKKVLLPTKNMFDEKRETIKVVSFFVVLVCLCRLADASVAAKKKIMSNTSCSD